MTSPRLRVLVNSLPKSGTHLLAQAVTLCGFPEHFAGEPLDDPNRKTPLFFNYREARDALALESQVDDPETIAVGSLVSYRVPLSIFRRWLEAMPQGCHILGHLPWTPLLPPLLAELDIRHVFIIRDPRAVLISLLAFILDSGNMPRRHVLEADLKDLLPQQRLDFIARGGYAPKAGVTIAGFSEMYQAMLNWREAPECLFLRYEDLVGVAGGGSNDAQLAAAERLAVHLGVHLHSLSPEQVRSVYNPNARTFRSGTIDGWRQAQDTTALARLEAICAPLCQELGY